MKRFGFLLIVIMIAAIVPAVINGETKAYAAGLTCEWTGAAGTSMNNSGNWTNCSGGVPGEADTVVFADNSLEGNVVNDLGSNPLLAGMQIGASFNFSGNPFQIAGTIDTTADTYSIFSNQVEFSDSLTLGFTFTGTANELLQFDNDVVVTGETLSINGGATQDRMIFNADLSGTFTDFEITNMTTVTFNSTASTTTGGAFDTDIDNSTVICYISDCAGDDPSGTIDLIGLAQIILSNDITIENSIEVNSNGNSATIFSNGGNNIISGNLSLNESDLNVFIADGESSLDISGNITLTDSGLITQGATSVSLGESGGVTFSGNVSGTGSISSVFTSLIAEGTWTLDGQVRVFGASALEISDITASSVNADYVVEDGATLLVSDSGTINVESMQLSGEGAGVGAYTAALVSDPPASSLTVANDIEIVGTTRIEHPAAADGIILQLTGIISGDGELILWMPNASEAQGTIDIAGSDPNTLTGDLNVHGGVVRFYKELAVPNDLVVDLEEPATQTYASINVDDAVGGNFEVNSPSALIGVLADQTVSSIAGDGIITIGEGATLTITNYSDVEFDGMIVDDVFGGAGDRFVAKNGTGTFTINTAGGQYFINTVDYIANEGTTILTDTEETGYGFDVSLAGGTLKGAGTINSLLSYSGTTAPGTSPGCMTVEGDITYADSASTLEIELGGTAVCSEYDQLIGTSSIILNGAQLTLGLIDSFVPSEGDVFTIVRAPVIAGTFNGIVDGNVYENSGVKYLVNYNFDDNGEDSVTLIVQPFDTPTSGTIPAIGSLPATGSNVWSQFLGAFAFAFGGLVLLFLVSIRNTRIKANNVEPKRAG